MKRTMTFAALAMCASLYLTPGAQAGVAVNGLHVNSLTTNGLTANGLATNGLAVNGLTMNGLSNNGLYPNDWANGLALQLTSGERESSPAVPNDRLPFNGLSQQGIGKRQPSCSAHAPTRSLCQGHLAGTRCTCGGGMPAVPVGRTPHERHGGGVHAAV
jgi:hypothetical protein